MNLALPRFSRLSIADHASVERYYSLADIQRWCSLASVPTWNGHVPEPLIAGLFSCLLGEQLPGHGTNYLKQHMRFQHHARPGERLTATVRVTRLRADKALVNLDTQCVGEDGRVICSGDALVLFQH